MQEFLEGMSADDDGTRLGLARQFLRGRELARDRDEVWRFGVDPCYHPSAQLDFMRDMLRELAIAAAVEDLVVDSSRYQYRLRVHALAAEGELWGERRVTLTYFLKYFMERSCSSSPGGLHAYTATFRGMSYEASGSRAR